MKGKYLSPKADLTFKLVFAEHKDLMMSLLNALLPLAENAPVEKYDTLDMLEYVDIRKAMNILDKSAMSEAQLYAYERFWDEVNRNQVLNESHFKKGLEKGVTEVAKKMKQKGLPSELIEEMTGLSTKEIENL